MKHCPRCKVVKDLSEFYANGRKASAYCKGCSKIAQREWYEANKERKADINRAWRSRNVERRKVTQRGSNMIYAAIRKGLIVRAEACEMCHSTKDIEAAHWDYQQPLVVKWLCSSCHRQWDTDEPKSLKIGKAPPPL